MRIERATSTYNQRRYGRPWIARVTFDDNGQATFAWGNWVGDSANGSAGTLLLDVEPGDIVATGQRDNRQPRNSSPSWYQVGADGELVVVSTKAQAYQLYRDEQARRLAAAEQPAPEPEPEPEALPVDASADPAPEPALRHVVADGTSGRQLLYSGTEAECRAYVIGMVAAYSGLGCTYDADEDGGEWQIHVPESPRLPAEPVLLTIE